ncbi:hypothetical protein [Candidatus Harpocratesius sp.]
MKIRKDPALILKEKVQLQESLSDHEIQAFLTKSPLITQLLTDPKWGPEKFVGLRAIEWRLLELSEIPHTYTMKKVKQWMELLVKYTKIDDGFSLRGTANTVLACHNAMITTILIRLRFQNHHAIEQGIDWIIKYQSTARDQECAWEGTDLYTKYGGCMKKTPCYDGVVKSMVALSEYCQNFGGSKRIKEKLRTGLEYILQHQVFKRFSTNQPIEDSIILNFYPFTYKTNIIEILSLLHSNQLLNDPRCKSALEMVKKKQRADKFWQADTSFMKSSWIDFDQPKKPGLWITNYIQQFIFN